MTTDVEALPAAHADGSAREETLRELLTRVYLTVDRRTLGLTRVLLGFYLLCDLARRTPAWLDMFSDTGVLPTHVILRRPMADNVSLFHAFTTAPELWALWLVGLAAYGCLLVGYKTKVAQIASLVFVTSMNGRVLLIENGGYVVQNLLLLWTCFLPLGDRFSIDALAASMRRTRERTVEEIDARARDDDDGAPVVSLAVLAVLLQLTAVYFFNVVHKTGPAWRNGTAVHFVLYNDRMATPFVPLVRDHLPLGLVRFFTSATMAFEAALPLCLLSPIAVPWSRRAVVFMMCTLHIAFGATFTLGPFAWALCVFSTLMFTREDWELAIAAMRRPRRARVVLVDERRRASMWIARVLARLDRLELLTFRAATGLTGPFELESAEGERARGADALAGAIAALPLGPIVAWAPRLPFVRGAIDAAGRWLASPRADAWLPRRSSSCGAQPVSPAGHAADRAKLWVGQALVAITLAAAVNQALVELWVAQPLHAKQSEPMRVLTHKLRFLQGWFMFSPNPVMDDGILVCDAETIDGRHVDVFTGAPPRFALGGFVQFNQIWQDYMNRIQLPGNSAYREETKAWILRYHERTGRPEDRIVAARLVWITATNPRIGSTESTNYQEREVMAFDGRADR
ncbi:MAG TPA: HTTM domain-containing protein [Byssovorax sp.]